MASPIDVCNVALSHLGDPANVASIDPPEGSPQARYCARYYPIARDEAQERHSWAFNTRRAALASLVLPTAVAGEWEFAYALPTQCLRATHVYVPGVTKPGETEDFAIETAADGSPILYANVECAYLKFRVQVIDTTRFPPSFVVTLSYLLARYLSGPLTKDAGKTESMDKLFRLSLASAAALDSQSQSADGWREERKPGWVAAR